MGEIGGGVGDGGGMGEREEELINYRGPMTSVVPGPDPNPFSPIYII